MEYLTKEQISERVKKAIADEKDRSGKGQEEIARDIGMQPTSLTKAKNLEKYPYYTAAAEKALRALEGKTIEKGYYKLEDV